MNKLTILDDSNKYEINNAQDLYDLYNDWSIGCEIMSEDDFQAVSSIRENYIAVYEKIDKRQYKLYEFEQLALEIIDHE